MLSCRSFRGYLTISYILVMFAYQQTACRQRRRILQRLQSDAVFLGSKGRRVGECTRLFVLGIPVWDRPRTTDSKARVSIERQ
jgi:hypothetical protein